MTSVNRILTTGDFAALIRLEDEWRSKGRWLGACARKIIEEATVVFATDLPPDVASIGSRVIYREKSQASRTVELTALHLFEREFMPIHLPLGLALLGRREQEEFHVEQEDGSVRRITLEKVLEQPERTWPGRFGAHSSVASGRVVKARLERDP